MTRFIAHLRETARGGGALPAWASKGEREAIARHFAGHARAVPAGFVEAESDREDAFLPARRPERPWAALPVRPGAWHRSAVNQILRRLEAPA